MSVSILIATYGDEAWGELGWSRAYPSAAGQGALEVLVEHLPGGTLAEARNLCAARASGDHLLFLDADDELCPGYVAAMEDALGYRDNVLLAPAVHYGALTLPGTWTSSGLPQIPNRGRWPDANECVIGTLVPRALFLEVGGFRELPSLEDYDLWLRCWKAGARIVHVPDAVYCAHVSAGSRNSDQSVYEQLKAEHAEVWAW